MPQKLDFTYDKCPILMDLSLFTHINNDAHLSGTRKLEGQQFKNTIGFLNFFVEEIYNSNTSFPIKAVDKNKLNSLRGKLQSLTKLVEEINEACHKFQILTDAQREQSYSNFSNITNKIIDIPNGEDNKSIFFPGGWSGSPGHAMIYEFRKEKNGDLIFLIYNSGAGLNYHEKKTDLEKDRYNPVKAYKIPKAEVTHENLNFFIKQLLKPKIEPHLNDHEIKRDRKYDAQRVYCQAIASIAYLGGVEVSPATISENFKELETMAQRSGTCAEKVLHQLIKSTIADKKLASEFIFCLKKYSIAKFFDENKKNFDDKKVSQLNLALTNLARILVKNEKLFDHKEIEETKIFMETIKKNLLTYQPSFSPPKPFNPQISLKSATKTTGRLDQPFIENNPVKLPLNLFHEKVSIAQPTLEELEKFIQALKTLSKINDHQAISKSIENLLLLLPLNNKDYYRSLSLNQKLQLMSYFSEIIKFFENSSIHIDSNNYFGPKRVILLLKFKTLIKTLLNDTLLCRTWHNDDKNVVLLLEKCPYLETKDPIMDKTLSSIINIENKMETIFDDLTAYTNIIKNEKNSQQLGEYLTKVFDTHAATKFKPKEIAYIKEKKLQNEAALIEFISIIEKDKTYSDLANKIKLKHSAESICGNIMQSLKSFNYYHLSNQKEAHFKVNYSFNDEMYVNYEGLCPNSPAINEKLAVWDGELTNKEIKESLAIDFAASGRGGFLGAPDISSYQQRREKNFHPNSIQCGIKTDQWNSQSETSGGVLTKESVINKMIWHLRSEPQLQALTTLDFFYDNLDLLKERDYQIYFEKNLFEPNVINKAILQNENFFNNVNNFLDWAITYFSQESKGSINALYFHELKYHFNSYIQNADFDKNQAQANIMLHDLKDTLNSFANLKLSPLANLTKSRILLKVLLNKSVKNSLSEQESYDLFYHYLTYKKNTFLQNKVIPVQMNEENELSEAVLQFFSYNQNKLNTIATKFCNDVQINIQLPSSPNWKIHFPELSVTKADGKFLRIDLVSGLLWEDDKILTTLPNQLLLSEIYQTFYGNEKRDGILQVINYQNGYDNKKINIKNDLNEGYFIETPRFKLPYVYQCKKQVNGQRKIYELQKLVNLDSSITTSQLACNSVCLPLPASFFCESTKVWRSINDNSCFIEREGKKYLFAQQQLKELTNDNLETGYSLYNIYSSEIAPKDVIEFYDLFSEFEDKSFIEILKKNDSSDHGPDLKIYFPRYGLELYANYTKPSWEITASFDKNLKLQSTELISLPQLKGALVFDNGKEKMAILPKQELIQKKENLVEEAYETVYPHFVFDVSNKIKTERIENNKKESEEEAKEGIKHQANKDVTNQQPWHYINSETYHLLPLDNKTQRLKAIDVKTGLYAAYLNLGQFKPLEALSYIKEINRTGGIRGTNEELEYIWQILKNNIESAEYIAVKIQAMLLLTHFIAKGNNLHYEITPRITSTKSELCQELKETEIKNFYDEITYEVLNCLNYYHHTRNNVPFDLKLLKEQEYEMLHFLHISNKLEGPLEKRYQELKGRSLGKELAYLKSQKNAPLSEKERVLQKLDKEQAINVIASKLDSEDIFVKTPAKFSNCSEEISESEQFFKFLRSSQKQLLPMPGITDKDFLMSFKYYYTLANGNSVAKNHLKKFCERTVLANSEFSEKKMTSIVPVFAGILLKIMEFPDSFRHLSFPNDNTYSSNYDIKNFVTELFSKAHTLTSFLSKKSLIDNKVKLKYQSPSKLKNKPIVEKIISADFSYNLVDNANFLKMAELNGFVENFKTERKLVENKIHDLINADAQIKNKMSGKDLFSMPFEDAADDIKILDKKIGALRNQLNVKLQEQTIKSLANAKDREKILEQTIKFYDAANNKAQQLGAELLVEANKGPFDIIEKKHWDLKLLGQSRQPLAMSDLYRLYVLADKNEYKKITKLPDNEIIQLHQKMTDYVQLCILSQMYDNRKRALNKCKDKDLIQGSDEYNNAFLELGSALMEENLANIHTQPEMQFFQKEEGMLIYPLSIYYLDKLLKVDPKKNVFINEIIQLIMGGGKSKVISPLTSLIKANGTNLAILQVKGSLFNTNYADNNGTSLRLFNQEAIPFIFDRNSPCVIDDLKKIYYKLKQAIVNKNYIVTTGESLQSLELKYLETLLAQPEVSKNPTITQEWQRQVKWLEKSLLLIKNANRVIDEVHEELSQKKILNYTLEAPNNISKTDIQTEIDLFYFLEKVDISSIIKRKNTTLFNLIQNNIKVTDPHYWDLIFEKLATDLVYHNESPLAEIIKKMSLSVLNSKELVNYLLNKSDAILDKIAKLDTKEKEQIAFLKGQLSTILPFNLKKNLYEHYGPSKILKTPLEKRLAIPYRVSDTPNEKARFTFLEFMNYTMMMNLKMDFSKEFIDQVLNSLVESAKMEMLDDPSLTLDKTLTNIKFTQMMKGTNINLSDIYQENNGNDNYIKAVNKLKSNSDFKKYCLKEFILPQIKVSPSVLSSNTQNLCAMTKTTQGMTGTPSNYRAMHQDLVFNATEGLGVDGETIDLLIQKNTAVHFCEVNNDLLDAITKNTNTCAIIDAGAFFKGESNEEVARQIAEKTKNRFKYILYFDNNEEVLYAINVSNGEKIRLNTTNEKEISKILNCSPEERFTFYDQGRITGTDIVQAKRGHAFVTVNERSTQDTLLQAVKRMRQLSKGQTVSLWLLSYLEPRVSLPNPLQGTLNFVAKNQDHEILELHLRGTLQKYKNVIRENLLFRIYAEKDIRKKAELLKTFKHYFIVQYHQSHFKNFGLITESQTSEKFFNERENEFFNDWKKILSTQVVVTSEEEQVIREKLQKVSLQGKNACAKTILAPKKSLYLDQELGEFELGNEVELENELETETEQELELELMFYEEKVSADRYTNDFDFSKYGLKHKIDYLYSMNEYLKGRTPCPPFLFSDKLHITPQFVVSHITQKQYFCPYLKPIEVIMMVYSDKTDTADAIVMTKREAAKYISGTNKVSGQKFWLCSPRGTILYGNPPERLPENYVNLLEQIRFLNADCKLLAKQKEPLTWMQKDTNAKLTFFEKYVLPLQPLQSNNYKLLKGRCDVLQKILSYIASHPMTDFSTIHWNTIYSGYNQLKEDRKHIIKELIKAYEILNKQALTYNLDLIDGVKFDVWLKSFPEEVVYLIIDRHTTLKKQCIINKSLDNAKTFAELVLKHDVNQFGKMDFDYLDSNGMTPLQKLIISLNQKDALPNIKIIMQHKSGFYTNDTKGITTYEYIMKAHESNPNFAYELLKAFFEAKALKIEKELPKMLKIANSKKNDAFANFVMQYYLSEKNMPSMNRLTKDVMENGLLKAASLGHDELLSYLLENKIATNITNDKKMTPLMCAINSGHEKSALLLLNYSMSDALNMQNDKNETALMLAIAKKQTNMIEAIIACEPDLTLKNQTGLAAYDICEDSKIKSLLSKKAAEQMKHKQIQELFNKNLQLLKEPKYISLIKQITGNAKVTFSKFTKEQIESFEKSSEKFNFEVLKTSQLWDLYLKQFLSNGSLDKADSSKGDSSNDTLDIAPKESREMLDQKFKKNLEKIESYITIHSLLLKSSDKAKAIFAGFNKEVMDKFISLIEANCNLMETYLNNKPSIEQNLQAFEKKVLNDLGLSELEKAYKKNLMLFNSTLNRSAKNIDGLQQMLSNLDIKDKTVFANLCNETIERLTLQANNGYADNIVKGLTIGAAEYLSAVEMKVLEWNKKFYPKYILVDDPLVQSYVKKFSPQAKTIFSEFDDKTVDIFVKSVKNKIHLLAKLNSSDDVDFLMVFNEKIKKMKDSQRKNK